jgi:hypothetical protein
MIHGVGIFHPDRSCHNNCKNKASGTDCQVSRER